MQDFSETLNKMGSTSISFPTWIVYILMFIFIVQTIMYFLGFIDIFMTARLRNTQNKLEKTKIKAIEENAEMNYKIKQKKLENLHDKTKS